MSLVGQVDWYFQVTVWARETCGMATAAAPVAPAARMNLRRDVVLDVRDLSMLIDAPSQAMKVGCDGPQWGRFVGTNVQYGPGIPAGLAGSLIRRAGIAQALLWSR